MRRIGVIDVGGGFRGIYAAGVLDYCLENNICFDIGIGVSAGSANIASFAAKQKERNLKFYTEYGQRKEYAGIGNFLKKGSFIDLDYVYGTLSNSDGEYPLDYDAMICNPLDIVVVAAEAVTGKTKYFTKQDIHRDNYDLCKASSAIPFVCRPYEINGVAYYDGALADPVPVRKAFDLGCDKVVVILTKPADEIRLPGNDLKLAKRIQRKYPIAAEKLRLRADNYNFGVSLAQNYAVHGKVLIVAPDDTCGVNTLTRDPKLLRQLYHKGYADGEKIKDFLSAH
ncbi:MAG: patatin family protein [Clostridia bacterium]|nr:patatin family protein [Clostridia bacterium]